MHSVSTVILTDFYRKGEDDEAKRVRLAKWLTGIVGIFGTAIALMMATFEIKSMFDLWMEIIALIGGGFGGVFLLGMFTKSANSKGVLIGAAASIIVTIFVKSYTDIHFMLYSSVAVGTCILVGYLSSFLFATTTADLKGLTVYTREK
jgi:Na+/proline symporter